MDKRFALIFPFALALCCCANRAELSFPGNMSAMPVVDAGHYDNPAADLTQEMDHPDARFVEAITAEAVAAGVPGVVLLIDRPDGGTWVSAKGSIDLKNKVPIKRDSLSRIGSVTKMFTAVVVHQLAQEGKLALDDPASKHLGEEVTTGIAGADKATIRHLLGHSSGIVNYTDHYGISALVRSGTNKNLTSAKVLDLVRGLPSEFESGTDCRYSNTNYILLGLIAEKAGGKSLADLFRERIFTPLGLASTYYDPDTPVQRGVARGYVELPAGNLIDTTDFDEATRTPDGGIVSDVYDMATFLHALVRGKLLSAASYAEMTGDLRPNAKMSCLVGLGILKFDPSDGVAYGHPGGHFGYTADLWYASEKRVTLAYLINGSSHFGSHVEAIKEFRRKAFALLTGEP